MAGEFQFGDSAPKSGDTITRSVGIVNRQCAEITLCRCLRSGTVLCCPLGSRAIIRPLIRDRQVMFGRMPCKPPLTSPNP